MYQFTGWEQAAKTLSNLETALFMLRVGQTFDDWVEYTLIDGVEVCRWLEISYGYRHDSCDRKIVYAMDTCHVDAGMLCDIADAIDELLHHRHDLPAPDDLDAWIVLLSNLSVALVREVPPMRALPAGRSVAPTP